MDFFKALLPLLAQANKATVAGGINLVVTNAALIGLHISLAPAWEQFAVTVVVAAAHAAVVYFTPNAPAKA